MKESAGFALYLSIGFAAFGILSSVILAVTNRRRSGSDYDDFGVESDGGPQSCPECTEPVRGFEIFCPYVRLLSREGVARGVVALPELIGLMLWPKLETYRPRWKIVIFLRTRSSPRLLYAVAALLGLVLSTEYACAGTALSAELRQQITEAEMTPWNGGNVSLDETLRGPNHEKVSLRQFVGRPILAYNYAQW